MSLVLIVGTGTEIGKTHLGEALLLHLAARGRRVVGYKPVESGVAAGEEGEDACRLRLASSFHVKPPLLTYRLPRPVSPNVAARDAGITLDVAQIHAEIRRAATAADVALVELAGGLFSPLTDAVPNADLVRDLKPAAVILVAPDRLGVLHDLGATTRAAAAVGILLCGIVLSAPLSPDASTGTNADEIPLVTRVPFLARLPRAPAAALATTAAVSAVADAALSPRP